MPKRRRTPGNPRIPVVKTVPGFNPTETKISAFSNNLLITKIMRHPDKERKTKFKIKCEFVFTARIRRTNEHTAIIRKTP